MFCRKADHIKPPCTEDRSFRFFGEVGNWSYPKSNQITIPANFVTRNLFRGQTRPKLEDLWMRRSGRRWLLLLAALGTLKLLEKSPAAAAADACLVSPLLPGPKYSATKRCKTKRCGLARGARGGKEWDASDVGSQVSRSFDSSCSLELPWLTSDPVGGPPIGGAVGGSVRKCSGCRSTAVKMGVCNGDGGGRWLALLCRKYVNPHGAQTLDPVLADPPLPRPASKKDLHNPES